MGAKASKNKVKGSSVVRILQHGKKETYSRPVSAQEVMLRYPEHVLTHQRHVLTHLNVLRSDIKKAIVAPETVLLPGNKYYLVSRRTVQWLLDPRTDLTKTLSNLSGSTSNKSDIGTNTLHIEINLGSGPTDFMDGMSTTSIIASPRRSQDAVELKPSITFTEEPLQTARGKSANGTRPKSPLGITRNSETSQRSWRGSPKVCPGEEESMYDEQISDIGYYIFSPVKDELIRKLVDDGRLFRSPIEDENKRKKVYHATGSTGSMETSWHVTLSPLLPRSASMQLDRSSNQEAPACNFMSQSPASVVTNNVKHALQREEGLPCYRRSLSVQESTEASKNKSLFELLKYPDINITNLVEDKQQCIPPFALKVNIVDKIHDISQDYDNDKGWEGTCTGNTPIVELGLLRDDEATKVSQQNECSTLSESLLTDIASIDLESDTECQQKEGCAYMPPENMLDQPTSNLMLSLHEESVQLCRSMEKEAFVQTIPDSKAIDIDTQLVPALDDILSWQSPNHLELIDSRFGKEEKNVCGMGDVSSLSLSVSLLASPSSSVLSLVSSSSLPSSSSSSLSLSSSSPSSSSSLSSLASSSAPSSSFSSSFSSSASSSLSQLMVLDLAKAKRVDQSQKVNNYAKTQRNLAMLGFSSLHSGSVSIFEQAKAHRRAHIGKPWKIASSKMSSSEEQEQERVHPSKRKREHKEAWQPFRPFPMLSPRRLHNLLLQPPKNPLSPIPEFSPEQSPDSISPLSDCPSSST